ncbi:MAG: TetR/AcrR family transcriptional regulator [Flavobacteriaceae bacterium]|jgi:AcrR family transcriptional regulator|tara:strand:+ start:7718 stop:8314 length:597 start_codon:yes stop_codon:yes gene_type:complete
MKDKILHNATEMFLNLGFKSVTMDDIAKNSGVSKKTIYAHFSNKTDLVEVVTDHLFETVCTGIDLIHEQQKNPIIELFDIKRFVMEHLKDEKSSPQYQLQKYYPKIYATLKQNQFEKMQGLIKENLDKGINQGLYRDSIDVDFIARIYFNGMVGIKDKDLFPLQNFSMNTLMNYYLEYHLRGICTTKGIQELENQLYN